MARFEAILVMICAIAFSFSQASLVSMTGATGAGEVNAKAVRTADDMKDQIDSVVQRRKEWVSQFNTGDMEVLAHLLTEEATWIPPHQPAVAGRVAIIQWLQPFFVRFKYEFRTSGETVRLAGDWAIDRGDYSSRIIDKESGEPMEHSGSYVLLWRLEKDGFWRIDRYIDLSAGEDR